MKRDSELIARPSSVSTHLPVLGAVAVSAIALAIYCRTLAPSVTWSHDGADSGDLAAASFTLGIPHPPGYPLFTLLGALFAHLPFFEPANGVGILAAIAGALAIIVLCRAGFALISPPIVDGFAPLVPSLAALGFAFAPALWSQATIAEVYTLNLLFVAIILWAMVSDNPNRVAIAAGAFGFGMAHHLSILLFAPGAWLALKPTRRDIRSLLLVFGPLVLYAYLPMRAASDPPVNWGNPSTLDGFLWVVTAAPYRSYIFDLSFVDIANRVAFTARLLFEQFTALGVAVALWGLFRLARTRPDIANALELSAALVIGYALIYASRDSFVYLLPAFAIVLLWLIYGAVDMARLLDSLGVRSLRLLIPVALAALALYNLLANFASMDLSTDREARDYAQAIIEKKPRDAVIFADGDEAVFALVYYRYVVAANVSHAVVVSQDLLQYSWYYDEIRKEMRGINLAEVGVNSDYHKRSVDLVDGAFTGGRTVCFTKSSPLLPEFKYGPNGDLTCVVAREQ